MTRPTRRACSAIIAIAFVLAMMSALNIGKARKQGA